jgi:hypothetical protein
MNLQEQINRIHEMMFEQENDSKINETDNTEKILFKLIDKKVEDADLYEHKGSLWLIFTDDKIWVLEFTDYGTLWYNYNFFNSFFKYLSLDVVKNQHYITEWVEDTIQNGVRPTNIISNKTSPSDASCAARVEDTIQNGTKIGNIKNG